MPKRFLVVFALLALSVMAFGVADASGGSGFRSAMNGDKEIDDGDPNGRGTFTARFNNGRLCYTLRFSGLDDPVAAHIHRGRSTENGAVVIDLKPRFTDAGARARCVSVPAALRRSIRRRPARFYVNVHTQQFPDGAIRGQLRRP